MNNSLVLLKEIERDLVAKLEGLPLFIQLESLRKTIATFEVNGYKVDHTHETVVKPKLKPAIIPTSYNAANLTWKEKVLYVIKKLGTGSMVEIVKEFETLEPKQTTAFLYKRVGVTLTRLKKDKVIQAKQEGKKSRYYI